MDQAEINKRELMKFQVGGANFGAQRDGRFLLLMDCGTGKTPTSSKVVALMQCTRLLVTCPENALTVWAGSKSPGPNEFSGKDWLEKFTGKPWIVHRMDDSPWERERIWNLVTPKGECHLYVVVVNTFANDMGVPAKVGAKARAGGKSPRVLLQTCKPKQGFDGLIVDEARRVRNHSSAGFRALAKACRLFNIGLRIPMTGTMVSRGPQNCWTALHLVDPKRFSSYWQFVAEWCDTCEDPWGGSPEILGLKKTKREEWYKLLAEYAWIVDENDPDVQSQRPPILRQQLRVDMDPIQKKAYNEFKRELLLITDDGKAFAAQSGGVWLIRLRQLLICPKVLSTTLSIGGAFKDVMDKIAEEEVSPPIVVFCPFTAPFDHWIEYARERGFPHIFQIHGGISADVRDKRIQQWRVANGIILVSIRYAQAFSLEPAVKEFFIGCEWDANDNIQAEKRCQRMSSDISKPINSYYYTYNSSTDERVFDLLNTRFDQIEMTMPKNFRQLYGDQSAPS